MKKIIIALLLSVNVNAQQDYSPLYFCTAADTEHFAWLKTLIGSIHATNFDHTAEIAVYNLGFTQEEIALLNTMEKVKIYDVEMTHPDLLKKFVVRSYGRQSRGWYAWKPVAIKQALDMFPYVLFLDAGCVVLKPLDNLFQHIQQNGYFLFGSHYMMRYYTTKTVAQLFNLYDQDKHHILNMAQTESNIQGICKSHTLAYEKYLLPAYEMSKNLHAYFADDGTCPHGFGMGRHDQTVASILAHLLGMKVHTGYTCPTQIKLHINNEKIPFHINTHNWNWNHEKCRQEYDDSKPIPSDTDIFTQSKGRINCEQSIVYKKQNVQ